ATNKSNTAALAHYATDQALHELETALSTPPLDPLLAQALQKTYGSLASYATLNNMDISPDHVQPPQHIHYKASGFHADGPVLFMLLNPGQPPIAGALITANRKGTISGNLILPTLTPGTYLLTAIDMTSASASLTTIKQQGTITQPVTYIT